MRTSILLTLALSFSTVATAESRRVQLPDGDKGEDLLGDDLGLEDLAAARSGSMERGEDDGRANILGDDMDDPEFDMEEDGLMDEPGFDEPGFDEPGFDEPGFDNAGDDFGVDLLEEPTEEELKAAKTAAKAAERAAKAKPAPEAPIVDDPDMVDDFGNFDEGNDEVIDDLDGDFEDDLGDLPDGPVRQETAEQPRSPALDDLDLSVFGDDDEDL